MKTNAIITHLLILQLLRCAYGVPLDSFFAYTGDLTLGANAEIEVQLPAPFWFFGANYTRVYVYANGVISLGQQLTGTLPSLETHNGAIIAPFWTDRQATGTSGSDVFYQVTNDTDSLEKAGREIGMEVHVSHVFIVTWRGVHGGLESPPSDEQSNTFQTVLVLSGRQSHVLFYYGSGEMHWSGDDPYAVVGFNAGDGDGSFALPTSGTKQVLQVTETGNTGLNGGWVFRVDGEEIAMRGVLVGFEKTEYTVPEPTIQLDYLRVCIHVLGETLQESVNIVINQHDGTATKKSDYSTTTVSFFLSHNSKQQMCKSIALLGDNSVEYNETYSITLDPTRNVDNLILLPRTSTITIVDDDTVLLTHINEVLIAMEGGGNVGDRTSYQLCAQLGNGESDNAPQRPITASLSIIRGTATENVDYIPPNEWNITFGYSEDNDGHINTVACIEVTILNDDVYEGKEDMFYYVLDSEDPDVIVDTSLGTVVIMDDAEDGNNIRLGLDQSTFTVVEGQDETACLDLIQGSFQYPLTFTIKILRASFFIDGNRAKLPEDLIEVRRQVTFYPGNTTSQCVTIHALSDNLYEGPEVAQIRVERHEYINIEPRFAPIAISDVNSVQIALLDSDYVYNENAGSIKICANLSGDIERNLTIPLHLEEGTATIYDPRGTRLGDFYRASSSITFSQSNRLSNVACTNISLYDDSFLEPEVETFNIYLENSDPGVQITTRNGITVSLLDDDHVNLRFIGDSVEVDEDVGKLPNVICIEREGASVLNITVQLLPMGGTALYGSDYMTKDDSFFIAASYSEEETVCASINLTIIEDPFVEGHETFFLQLMSDNPKRIRVRHPFTNLLLTQKITIRDNDVVSVNFTKVQFTVNEGDGGVDVCLQMTGLSFQITNFTIKTRPQSAIDGVDFISQTLQLSFPAANESEVHAAISRDPSAVNSLSADIQCAHVTIIDDNMLELDNTKTFYLTLHTDEVFAKLVNPTSAIVTIIDDDVVTLNLEETQITVLEGNRTAELCMNIIGEADFPIHTTLLTTDGSAIRMYDYVRVSASTAITFPAHNTSKQCTTVEIVDDSVVEEKEQYFRLFFDVDVTNPNVILGENSSGMITIIDDDEVLVGFESDEYSPLEGDGMVTVCAYLLGLMDRSVTVIASTQTVINSERVPMRANIDYEPVTDLLVFGEPSDQSNQTYCFDITIRDDIILEDTETFQVVLESSDPGVHLVQDRANVYVLDNDGVRMGLSEREYFTSESDESIPICVELVGRIEQNIVVNLNTHADSARVDADFEPVHANLTFTSSHLEQQHICTDIQLIDDPFLENEESFLVSVVIRNKAVSIHIQEAVVYLSDNDHAQISLARGGMVVGEDVGEVVICVNFMGQSERNVSYMLETTSRAGHEQQEDYTLSPNPSILVFPPSYDHHQQQCTPVHIFDDTILENNEYFTVNLSTVIPRVSVLVGTKSIEIEDNDEVTIGFNSTETIVNEDEPREHQVHQCVGLVGEIERSIVVRVSTEERNATEEDFVPIINEPLTFEPNGNKTLCTVVIVRGDRLVEKREHFELTLSTSDSAVILNPARTLVIIVDEDVVCLQEERDSSRGFYVWPETFPNEMAVLRCKKGEKSATRLCNANGEWGKPNVTNCNVSIDVLLDYIDRNKFTKENLRELLFALTQIGINDEEIAQRYMITLTKVFEEMASLIESDDLLVDTETFSIVLEIVDELQEWPLNVLRNYSSRVVKAMEVITTGYIKSENITEPFDASTVNLHTLGFYAQEGNLNDVFKADKNISISFIKQASRVLGINYSNPSSISSIALPPSLVDILSNLQEVGLFFLHYNSSAFFPLVFNDTRQDSTDCKGSGNETEDATCVSSVISATVSTRTNLTNLQDNVTFEIDVTDLRINYTNRNVSKSCVAWDFEAAGGKGNWTDKGCVLVEEIGGRVICSCNHLTNFAVLVNIEARTGDGGLSEPVIFTLEIISIVGVCMSLIGLALTMITLIVFNKLRKRDSTKFRVQLCAAMFMMLLVFICGIDRTEIRPICVTISGLIHYFTLVTMMWTAAEALLMFQKLIIVFTQITTRYLVIVSLVCWLLPIPAVVIPIAVDHTFVIHEEFCFISHNIVFFAAFLGPIGAIICFNFVIFIMVIFVLVKHTTKRYKKSNHSKSSKFGVTIRTMLSITGVMTIFGLTWLFGAFTVQKASEAFSFLFVIFNSLQGFFIFLFFVVLAKETRELWMQACGCKKKKSKSYTNTSTLSSHSTNSIIRKTQARPVLRRRTSQLSFDIENAERLKVLETIDPEIRMRMNSWDIMYVMPQNRFDVLLYSKTIDEEEIKETEESEQPKMVLVGTNPTQRKGSAENSSSGDSGIIIWMDNKSKCTPSPLHRQQQLNQQNSAAEGSQNPNHIHSVSGLGYISGSSNSSTHSLPYTVEQSMANTETPVNITVSRSYTNGLSHSGTLPMETSTSEVVINGTTQTHHPSRSDKSVEETTDVMDQA